MSEQHKCIISKPKKQEVFEMNYKEQKARAAEKVETLAQEFFDEYTKRREKQFGECFEVEDCGC